VFLTGLDQRIYQASNYDPINTPNSWDYKDMTSEWEKNSFIKSTYKTNYALGATTNGAI